MVQSIRAGLGVVQHIGGFVLRGGLQRALGIGCPEIFNTDQGAQFTSEEFTGKLQGAGIRISMDGRGRALDNVMVERLWRSVKYEEIYLWNYSTKRQEGIPPAFQR